VVTGIDIVEWFRCIFSSLLTRHRNISKRHRTSTAVINSQAPTREITSFCLSYVLK